MGRLTEPFIEFFRYLPAPAFGALAVAVLGIEDAPKIAIIFIGTFFQQVLVIANTTRRIDPALLEAAETLGASRRVLITRVVVPGVITDIYTDMRVLLGWAWTYLIVAELIGVSSGITYFINQQAKYRAYERVFASIILIGLIGLVTDLVLASLGRQLFPWMRTARRGWFSALVGVLPRARRARARARRGSERAVAGGGRARMTAASVRLAQPSRTGARGARALRQAEATSGHPGGARSVEDLRGARSAADARRWIASRFSCTSASSPVSSVRRAAASRRWRGWWPASRSRAAARCCSTASRSTARARIAGWCSRATRCFPG